MLEAYSTAAPTFPPASAPTHSPTGPLLAAAGLGVLLYTRHLRR
ncbi:MAG: hypothetical protein QCH35_08550 [Methanomicrobiaceae archaeon]|nr:hypothetical protein [Methanomicrobiaceae archaeon]